MIEDIAMTSNTDPGLEPGSLAAAAAAIDRIVLDKQQPVRLALACLLARGHLLIEDAPGMGKTLFAHALARVLGLEFKRVQFTSDLLPADVLGVSIYQRESGDFRFHPGPVFTQMLLVDEVNRASPKTQSALLEAMEEHQVTVDGLRRPLPAPFFVIATQNAQDDHGTYPLPEAQLDRFLMRIELGYPGRQAEYDILRGSDRRAALEELAPVMTPAQVLALQQQVEALAVGEPLLDYLYALLEQSRGSGRYRRGLSVRAAQGLLRAARAWALIDGRDYVVPADVQAVLPAVAGHRLATLDGAGGAEVGQRLLEAVAVPA